MNLTIILIYGPLIFLATVIVSIPFGFVEGFTSARGTPLSERTLALLKPPEYLLEAAAVLLVLVNLSTRQPDELLFHAVLAMLFASLIIFAVEVRIMLMSLKEFQLRMLIGLIMCFAVSLFTS